MPSNPQVPKGWRRVRLDEVADVVMGQSPPGDTVFDWDGGNEFVDGLPFTQGNAEFGSQSPKPIKWCVRPAKVAEAGDLLISVRAPVGETNRAFHLLAIGRGLAAIRFRRADPAFGWHAVNSAKHTLERLAQGSTFDAIGGKELNSLSLLIPPADEQRAIAAVLDSIDEAIERTEEVIAATERLRDALLHDLLTRGLPGRHTEWKQVQGLGTIPASWDVVRLGDVAGINRQSWKPTDLGEIIQYLDLTAVVGPGNVSEPHELAASEVPSRARRRAGPGDILVSTVRPNLRGFARLTSAPENLVVSTGFAVITPGQKAVGSFLYHHVMSSGFARHLQDATTGQAYPAVRPDDVGAYRLACPPIREQQVIAGTLDSVEGAAKQVRKELETLRAAKASAADAMLSGDIRVEGRMIQNG